MQTPDKNKKNKANIKLAIKEYLAISAKYKYGIFVSLLTIIIATAVNLAEPIFYKKFFDILSSGGDRSVAFAGIMSVIVAISLIKLVNWIAYRIDSVVNASFQPKISKALSDKAFRYLHGHSASYFNNTFVGALVKKARNFSSSYEDIFEIIRWSFIQPVITLVCASVFLYLTAPILGIIIIVWTVIYLVVGIIFNNGRAGLNAERNEAESSASALFADTAANSLNVKFLNGTAREISGYGSATEKLRSIRKKIWDMYNVFDATQDFLMAALEIGILVIAVGLWRDGVITVGSIVAIQFYIGMIFMRLFGITRAMRNFYSRLSDASEMAEIIHIPHEITDKPDAVALEVENGGIEVKNVDFQYSEGKELFNGFNLAVSPREKVAIVGPSGSGKSTLIKLLLRSADVKSGGIFIDGVNIANATQESLWHALSYVPQDPILFHRSLMDNIRYGRPEATDDEVISASKSARCHDFISELPEKYETFVGERGVKLSGGERQRVAIARAILRNSPIIIFDEATSSLDSESELLIQEALDDLMKGKTIIVIAHRLSTIRRMDRIIVIENGKITEEGGHEDLLSKEEGIYRKLWELQAGGFVH